MAASVAFINKMLDSGVQGTINAYTGIYVGLYSGGAVPPDGGYSHKQIVSFDSASNSTKAASARVSFSPTGASAGGWGYDEVRLYSNLTGTLLHSISTVNQFIINNDTQQILVTFSGY